MRRIRSFTPLGVVLLFLASAVSSILLANANDASGRASVPLLVATGIFTVVGAVVISRRASHLIGWLFVTTGLMWSLGTLGVEYSVYGVVTEPGSVPAAWIGAWFGEWNWIVFWYAALVITPMMFPTGRSLNGRWKWTLRVILVVPIVIVSLAMFDRNLEMEGTDRTIRSPIGTSFGSDPDDQGSFTSYLLPTMFLAAGIGLASLITRFRRSRGEERLQMKWLTFGSCVALISFLSGVIWDAVTGHTAPEASFAIGVASIPLGAGVGILKYRLYEIDVIINRALVYATLTAILAAFYLGTVFGLQQFLPLRSESDIAVAASTLAVAGLFRPVRARVQRFIDRRFYRSRYDAAETLAEFGARLRDQVDVDHVRDDALDLVATTVQPSHASIWLAEVT